MKKISLLMFLSITIASCSIPATPTQSEAKSVLENITYKRDTTTGLCFAIVQSYHDGYAINSIACVPCDSLQKIKIK